jgi:transcriptional regulator with XRE-family HTH domain
MALGGLTLEQIAEQIGVSDRTIDRWVHAHPELRSAMKPAKDFIDNLVEGSLLKRAMGYDVVEVTRENVTIGFRPDGSPKTKLKVTKKVTKHIPADPASMIVWMKNRKGWRDRVDMVHGGSIAVKPDYSKLSDEELVIARALAAKAEAHAGSN